MQNLAGHRDADNLIKEELTRCGIEVVEGDVSTGEVKTRYTGKLGEFTFRRAWYYLCVEGKMPLEAAMRLYNHPVGKRDIRADGYGTGPNPSTHFGTVYYHPSGKKAMQTDRWNGESKQAEAFGKHYPEIRDIWYAGWIADDNPKQYPGFVESYHVDSELGLYLLAEEIKKLYGKHEAPDGYEFSPGEELIGWGLLQVGEHFYSGIAPGCVTVPIKIKTGENSATFLDGDPCIPSQSMKPHYPVIRVRDLANHPSQQNPSGKRRSDPFKKPSNA